MLAAPPSCYHLAAGKRSTLVTKMMVEHLLQGKESVTTYSGADTVTESKLTLLGHMINQIRSMNPRDEVLRLEIQTREDGGLASQNHLIVPGPFVEVGVRGRGTK